MFFVFFASLYLVISLFFACFVSLSRVSLFFCFCFLPFRCLLRCLRFFLRSSFVLLRCSSLVFVRSFLLFIVVGSRAAVLSRGWRSSPQHRLLSSSFRFRLPVVFLLLRRRLLFLQSAVVLDIGDLSIVVQVASPGHYFRSRRVARASSVRDRFRIHQFIMGLKELRLMPLTMAVSQPSWLLLRSVLRSVH